MKFLLLSVIATFATNALAQSACITAAASLPACGAGYYYSAASSIGNCDYFDYQCQCSNSQQVQQAIVATLISACGNSVANYLNSVNSLCSCASANPGQTVSLSSIASVCNQGYYNSLEPCGFGYYTSAARVSNGCAPTDFSCLCSNNAQIENNIFNTLQSQCGAKATSFTQQANSFCSCVSSAGATSTTTSSTSSTTTSTSTASPSQTATSTPTSTSSSACSSKQTTATTHSPYSLRPAILTTIRQVSCS